MQTREHQWVEVDLEAIRTNVRAFKELTNKNILAVVKANGYGHGAVEVGKAAVQAGASYLGVTSIGEASLLRKCGISANILVMGPQFAPEYEQAVSLDLEFAVWNAEQISALQNISASVGKKARVHIKADIGMGRFGVVPNEVLELLRTLRTGSNLEVVGLISHLSASDADALLTQKQEHIAMELVQQIKAAGVSPPVIHIANSGGSTAYPNVWYDMIRLGIVLYGYPALPEEPVSKKLRRALSWKTKLVSVREMEAGSTISYGAEYVTKKREKIGVIAAGYADGLRRSPKNVNKVLIRRKMVPTVGRICQQFAMVNLDDVPDADSGDEVTLLDGSEGSELSAVHLAKVWGTNEWDVLAGINQLVERRYMNR